MSDDTLDRSRRPLRETVCDIDRDILKLVLRRHNLLARMASAKGRLAPQEERFLREAWEAQVAKVSNDPKLSSRFFTLLQEVEFLPRPTEDAPQRRPAFGLAPIQQPVRIQMEAPRDQMQTQLWTTMAASCGKPLHLTQVLMNDAVVDCVRMLNQLGCSLYRDADTLSASTAAPAGTPDKIIHVGDNAINFFLCLAHYLGRPSHAKFTGGPAMKLADFSALRRFLPTVEARLISLVPKSDGLPVRLESAGLLPDTIVLPDDLPLDFVLCLVAAAPFYQKPVTLDFATMSEAKSCQVFQRMLPLLQQAGISFERDESLLRLQPFTGNLPEQPRLDMDLSIATVLLSFAAVNGGSVQLNGLWPDSAGAAAVENFFGQLGLSPVHDENGVRLEAPADFVLSDTRLCLSAAFPADLVPMAAAFACIQALRHGRAALPEGAGMTEAMEDIVSLARACGLDLDGDQLVAAEDGEGGDTVAWTAPAPMWACALALTACARQNIRRGLALNNPGVLTELYPAFWALYNALPEPAMRRAEPAQQPKERRRVRTNLVAQLTPRPEEDE